MDRSDAVAKRKARILERAEALAAMRPTRQQQAALFAERDDEMAVVRRTIVLPEGTQRATP